MLRIQTHLIKQFYTNSNLPVTKIVRPITFDETRFYTNSNLPVTKILSKWYRLAQGFTLTQIFQLLKCQIALMKRLPQKTIINISVTTNIIIITYSRAVKKNFLLNVPAPFLPLFR